MQKVSGDILEEEILPRVEVKTLLRSRCVSKSWRSWIDSKRFINELQLQHSKRRSRVVSNRYVEYTNSNPILTTDSLCCCVGGKEESPITHPANHDLRCDSIVVGHHNGILCTLKKKQQPRFMLWNPATRICIKLPLLEGFKFNKVEKLGFGWDEESGAYKVFVGFAHFYDDYYEDVAKIYSSKTNSWTDVERGWASSSDHSIDIGVFVCGKIYWMADYEQKEYRKIESFDLNSEEFGATMMEPPCKGEGLLRLLEADGRFRIEGLLWLIEAEGRLCIAEGRLCITYDGDDSCARRVWAMDSSSNPNVWIEQEQPDSRFGPGYCVGGAAFSYIETLISPTIS